DVRRDRQARLLSRLRRRGAGRVLSAGVRPQTGRLAAQAPPRRGQLPDADRLHPLLVSAGHLPPPPDAAALALGPPPPPAAAGDRRPGDGPPSGALAGRRRRPLPALAS